MGCRFVSECNDAQKRHTRHFYRFFLPYLQDHGLVEMVKLFMGKEDT